MNLNILGIVVTVSLSELIGILLVIVALLIIIYVSGRFFILKMWYKKCPKCSGRVIEKTKINRAFNSSSSNSETYLKCVDCNWEKRLL